MEADFVKILDFGLAKSPADRPRDAAALLDLLDYVSTVVPRSAEQSADSWRDLFPNERIPA